MIPFCSVPLKYFCISRLFTSKINVWSTSYNSISIIIYWNRKTKMSSFLFITSVIIWICIRKSIYIASFLNPFCSVPLKHSNSTVVTIISWRSNNNDVSQTINSYRFSSLSVLPIYSWICNLKAINIRSHLNPIIID